MFIDFPSVAHSCPMDYPSMIQRYWLILDVNYRLKVMGNSQEDCRKPYLNKKRSVDQNDIFFKNVFNRKYI